MKHVIVIRFHPAQPGIFFQRRRDAFWWGKIYITPMLAWETTSETKQGVVEKLKSEAARVIAGFDSLQEVEIP